MYEYTFDFKNDHECHCINLQFYIHDHACLPLHEVIIFNLVYQLI